MIALYRFVICTSRLLSFCPQPQTQQLPRVDQLSATSLCYAATVDSDRTDNHSMDCRTLRPHGSAVVS